MSDFKSIITKENVTFLLALFGFIGTLISWLSVYVSQKKKVKLSIFSCSANEKGCLFYMMFENQSRLPIAITRIAIVNQNTKYDCETIPCLVKEKERTCGEELIERKLYYSLPIPISLEPLAAISGYVFFADAPLFPSESTKPVTFEVCTNRGKLKKTELQLPEARHRP